MKTVSKAIAIQMKKKKDMEKRADQGIYGKKLHANQSDVLNVQDVGRNETFQQIMGGGNDNKGRKYQIRKRRQQMAQEKQRRKKKKTNDTQKNEDDTCSVYNKCIQEMDQNWQAGYSTSDTEEDEPKAIALKDIQEEGIELDEETKKQLALEDAIRARWYIVSSRSTKRLYWDGFIIFFAVINGLILPLEMAFSDTFKLLDEQNEDSSVSITALLDVFSILTIIVFAIDIFIIFFSSFINVTSGDEIFDMKLIAINYIQGPFWIDFISTVPLDSIASAFNASPGVVNFMNILGILKIVRILRIRKLIANLNYTQETKALLKVANMVFYLILYIHLVACFLWMTFSSGEQTWIPQVDYIYASTKLFQGNQFLKQYLSMSYHAIMVFGLNEVGPTQKSECLIVILFMIMSAIVNAAIFGEMAVLVQEMDKKDIDFQESLDNANTAMHSLEIPDNIQDDIREYLMSVNEYKTQQQEMKDFMAGIRSGLAANVCKYIFFLAINQNGLLSKILKNQKYLEMIRQINYKKIREEYLYEKIIQQKELTPESVNFLNDIVQRTKIQFEEPEARIIKQNDDKSDNRFMFFIERGECIVQINDKDKMRNKSKNVRTLYPGDIFGEIAFLYDAKRSASVTSTNYTTLGKIPEDEIKTLFELYPFFKKELVKRTVRYDDDLKIFLESILKTIDYLQGVPDETINKIIFSMTFAKFDKGSKIFQVDETALLMQIIQNGMVEIYTTMDNGVEFVIERLYRGSVINHRSFITADKIDVNARCQMPVTLFYIMWNKMSQIRDECPVLSKKIDNIEMQLLNKDNPIALDYIISRDSTVLKNSKKRSRKEQAYRDKLTVKLKNAVMFYIVKTRILKRIPNFNEILNMAINKKKREMQAARRKQQEFDLDQLGPEDTYLTDEQFNLIKEQIEKIKITLDDQDTKLQSLEMKLINLIKRNPHYTNF